MAQRVLIVGSGGREHALAHHFRRYDVFVAPGNDGIAREFQCIKPKERGVLGLVALAGELAVDVVVVGPEDPLAEGLIDACQDAGISAFGPSRVCAQLEAKKSFMKELCSSAEIPTARYGAFDAFETAKKFITSLRGPIVVKADGLCAGKGVAICQSQSEALETTAAFLGTYGAARYGEASERVVIEEFLAGKEVSVIGICDGEDAQLFAPVRDHKRLLDGNRGPNTGGMGVIGPLQGLELPETFLGRVKEQFFLPVLRAMKKMGAPYRGFLYAGLMVHEDQMNLLEFNVRLGDPEAQALLFGSTTDLLPILKTVAQGGLLRSLGPIALENMHPTAVIVMTAPGYPDNPQHGAQISVPNSLFSKEGREIFYSGVKTNSANNLTTAGGRILSVACREDSLALALQNCYQAVHRIHFEGAHFRRDIGAEYAIL